MTSIGEPYVYTDMPEPLDDIQIKQDGDGGFEIRLNEAAYVYSNLSDNAKSGDESEHSNKGVYQKLRRRSNPKKVALHQNQCDDDVEVVDAKKGKRKRRTTRTTKRKSVDIPDVSLNLQKPLDNIFERMWNVEDLVEKSKMQQSSAPPVKVKEEKIEVIICDTDENTQSGEPDDNESVVECSPKRAKVKKRRRNFASGISCVNGEETKNRTTPVYGASIAVTETRNGKETENVPIINVLASDEEETSNNESKNLDPVDPVDFGLTKYDIIKMRRAKAKSTTTMSTTEDVSRNNKGKPPKRPPSESSHYDTDEEADDEDSSDDYNDSSSDVDSDETEIYSPKKTESSGSSDDESDEGNMQCPKCDARFKVVAQLKAHMLSHFSEKSYQCKICMRAFANNFNLKRHVKIHEREDNEWKTRKCSKGFSTRRQLEMHSVKEQPGFKRFKCSVCKERFAKKAEKEAHMMQHINDKVKQSNCEPQVKETSGSNLVSTDHLKRQMLPKTQKNKFLDENKNVSDEEQKMSAHSKLTEPSANVKLPHPNVNMTSSGIHTQFKEKCSQPNENANIAKPANVRSQAKTNTIPPSGTKVHVHLKENDEPTSDKTDNTKNQTSPQKTNHSITRTPPPVHKPHVKEIGRRATHIHSTGDPNQSTGSAKQNNNSGTHITGTNGKQSTSNSSMTTSVQTLKIMSKEPKTRNGKKRESTVITIQSSPDQKSNGHAVETPKTAAHGKMQTTNAIQKSSQTQKTRNIDTNIHERKEDTFQNEHSQFAKTSYHSVNASEKSTIIFSQIPQAAYRYDMKQHPVNKLTEKYKADANVVLIHEVHNKIGAVNVPIDHNLADQSIPKTRRRPNILSRSNLQASIPKKQLEDNSQNSSFWDDSTLPDLARSNIECKQNSKNDPDGIQNPVSVEKQSQKSKSAEDNDMFSDGEDSETPATIQQLLDHLDEIDLTSQEECAPTQFLPKEKEDSNQNGDVIILRNIHEMKNKKSNNKTKTSKSSTIITNSKTSPELTSKDLSNGHETEKQSTQRQIEKTKSLRDFTPKSLEHQTEKNAQKSPSAAKNVKENQHNSEVTSKNSSGSAQVDHNVRHQQTFKNSKLMVSEVITVNEPSIDGDTKSVKPSDHQCTSSNDDSVNVCERSTIIFSQIPQAAQRYDIESVKQYPVDKFIEQDKADTNIPKVVTSTDTMGTGVGSKQEDTFVTTQLVPGKKGTEMDPPTGKTISTAATETMASHRQTSDFGKKTFPCSSDVSITLTELSTKEKEVSSTNVSDPDIQTKHDSLTKATSVVRPARKGSPSDIANNMGLGQGKYTKCKLPSDLSVDSNGIMGDQLAEVHQSEAPQSDSIDSNKSVEPSVQSFAITTPTTEPLTKDEASTTQVDSVTNDASATTPVGSLTEDDEITTPLDPLKEDNTATKPTVSLLKGATAPIGSVMKDKLTTASAASLTNEETSTASINSSEENKTSAITVEVSGKDKSPTPLITSQTKDKTKALSVDSQTKDDSSLSLIESSTKTVNAVVSTEPISKVQTETALVDSLPKGTTASVILISEEEKPLEQLVKDVKTTIPIQSLTEDETTKTSVEPLSKDECSATQEKPLAKDETATTKGVHDHPKAKDRQEDILIQTTCEPHNTTAVSQSRTSSCDTLGFKPLNQQAHRSDDPSLSIVETSNSTKLVSTLNTDSEAAEDQGGDVTQLTPVTHNIVLLVQQSEINANNNNDQLGDTGDNKTIQPSFDDLRTESSTEVASQINDNNPTEAAVASVVAPVNSAETVVKSAETFANDNSTFQTPSDTALDQQGDTFGTTCDSTSVTAVQSSATKLDATDTNNINMELVTIKEKSRNNIAVSEGKINQDTLPTNESTNNCDVEKTSLLTKQQSTTKFNNQEADKNISVTTGIGDNVEHEKTELKKGTSDPCNGSKKVMDDNGECHRASQEKKSDQLLTANITEDVVTKELPQNRIEETDEDGHQTKTKDQAIDNKEINVVPGSLDKRFICSSEETPCSTVSPSSPQETKGQKDPIHDEETYPGCIIVEDDEDDVIEINSSQQTKFVSNENSFVPSAVQAQLEETVPGNSISDPVDTTNQRNETGTPSQSTLEKEEKITSHEDGTSTENVQLPDNVLKVAKLLTAVETKGSKLADVIKELLDNAPKEEKAEIRNLLKEQGLSEETTTSERGSASQNTSIVKRFEAKTYNGCNFYYQSSIHNKKSHHSRREFRVIRKRSRSRSRDRHFRRSRSRERKAKNEDFRRSRSRERQSRKEKFKGYPLALTTHKAMVRRCSPKHWGRSRYPGRTDMYSRSVVGRVRRSRSPEYRRHLREISPPRRTSHSRYRRSRSRSRSPMHRRRHSRSPPRRGPTRILYGKRRSVSPKRNSRSKDIPLIGFDKKHRSKLPLHEGERESRSSCSTERSGASRRSKERPMRRSSRSSEKDSCKERHSSRSSLSAEKSTFSDHSRSSPGRSSSNKERECSKTQHAENVDPSPETNRVVTIVNKKDLKRDLTSETFTTEMDNTETSLAMNSSDSRKTSQSTSEKDPHENNQRESSVSEITREIWHDSSKILNKLKNSYPRSSTFRMNTRDDENTKLKTTQSPLYDPWEYLDDQRGTTAAEMPEKTEEIPAITRRVNQWLDDQKPTDPGSKLSADVTELSSFIKPSDSTTEEWKKAWYQKVDNKKLIFDTIENDSYDKNNREQQKILLTKDTEKKENSFLLDKKENNIDDVFLSWTITTYHSPNKEASLSEKPKSRWDKKPWDLPRPNNVGKISTTVEPVKNEKEEKLLSELQTLDSKQNKDQKTWKVRPQTTVIESTSLFKDTCATEESPKSNYADFKVTIQNTAQFISVMESPASPDAELSNTENVPQILFSSRKATKTRENVALNVASENENKQFHASYARNLTGQRFRTPDKTEVKATSKKLSDDLPHQVSSSVSIDIGRGVTCNDSKRRRSDPKHQSTPTKLPKDRKPSDKGKSPRVQNKNSTDSMSTSVNDTLKQLHSALVELTKCTRGSSESIQETKTGVDARAKTVRSKSINIKGSEVAQIPVSPPEKVRKSLDPRIVRTSTKRQSDTSNEEPSRSIPNDDKRKLSNHRTFTDTTKDQQDVPFPVDISSTKLNSHEAIPTRVKPAHKSLASIDQTIISNNPPSLNEQTDNKHPNPTTTRRETGNKEMSTVNMCSEEGHLNESNMMVSKDPRLNKQPHSPKNELKSSSQGSKNTGDKVQDDGKRDFGDTNRVVHSDSNETSLEKERSRKDDVDSNETSHTKHLQDAAKNPNLAEANMLFDYSGKEEISRQNRGNDKESLSSFASDGKEIVASLEKSYETLAVKNSAPRKRHHSSQDEENSPTKKKADRCDHDTKEERKLTESSSTSMDIQKDKDLEAKGNDRTDITIESYERDKYKETSRPKERKLSPGDSGSSTPTLDEKNTYESVTQPSSNTEKRDHDSAIKETNSFYLASQERCKAHQAHYDKERGIWRSSTDSKSYWTKHPQSKENYNDSDEREYCSQSRERKNRSVSPSKTSSTGSKEKETAFRCNDCYKWFDSYFELNVHKVVFHGHGNKKVYMCQVCHEGFRYHDDLDRHTMTEHRRDCPLKCTDCGDTFSTEEKLKYHMCHKQGRPKSHDYSDFSDSRSKPTHIRRSVRDNDPELMNTKRYRAPEEPSYPNVKETGVEESTILRCHVCDQTFKTDRNLKNHMYARHRKGVPRPYFGWRRNSYGDYYRDTDTYRRHRISQHKHIVNRKHRLDVRSSPGRQGHRLSEETFVSSPPLSPFREESPPHLERMSPPKHFEDVTSPRLHDQLMPPEGATKTVRTDVRNPDKYQCAICEKKCLTKEEFGAHLRKHLETDRSKKKEETNCQISEKDQNIETDSNNVGDGLNNECENIGDSEATTDLPDDVLKRQCPVCEKVFATEWSKQRHMYIHSGERPFQCNIKGCFKSFVQKSDLKSHKLKVHFQADSRQKRCPWCPSTFKYEANYQAHMKTHNKPITEITGIVKCNLCQMGFTSNKAMMNHKKKMHLSKISKENTGSKVAGKNRFDAHLKKMCLQCGVKFLNEQMFKTHMLTHKGVNPYRCTIAPCQRAFGSNNALKRHVKHVHGDQEPTTRLRVCDACGAMFLTLNAFENHKQLHRGENPYKCTLDDCEKLFADGNALKRHQKQVHTYSTINDATRGARLNCTECGSIFYNSAIFDQHMKTHGIGLYTCPNTECSRTFQDIDGLQDHLKDTQGHDIGIIWKECRQCDDKFLTQHQVDKHREQDHSKSQIYKCTEPGCTSSYVNLFGLKRHWKSRHEGTGTGTSHFHDSGANLISGSHANETIHGVEGSGSSKISSSCETCGKKFDTARALKIHQQKMHAGKKQFKCNLCQITFTRSDSLLIHMNRHNNINSYKCQICKKTFLLRNERDQHRIEEHASEMTLGCPKCSRKFFDTKALRIHLFKTHDIKITATVVDNKREEHKQETSNDVRNDNDVTVENAIESELQE